MSGRNCHPDTYSRTAYGNSETFADGYFRSTDRNTSTCDSDVSADRHAGTANAYTRSYGHTSPADCDTSAYSDADSAYTHTDAIHHRNRHARARSSDT